MTKSFISNLTIEELKQDYLYAKNLEAKIEYLESKYEKVGQVACNLYDLKEIITSELGRRIIEQ